MATFTPDAKGRGAWTRIGGLLPAKPGQSGSAGYYRLSASGEEPVGAAYVEGTATTDAERAVNRGVRAIQMLCGLTGANADGWFGTMTNTVVRSAQQRLGIEIDGIVGSGTMRALLTKALTATASANGVPLKYLGGLIKVESLFDPAAVGYSTPADHGLPQINLAAFSATSTEPISYDQALDPAFSIPWTAKRMRATYDRWNGQAAAGVDPWEVAILNHNSPYNALRLAKTGAYPSAQSQQYVLHVMAAW